MRAPGVRIFAERIVYSYRSPIEQFYQHFTGQLASEARYGMTESSCGRTLLPGGLVSPKLRNTRWIAVDHHQRHARGAATS